MVPGGTGFARKTYDLIQQGRDDRHQARAVLDQLSAVAPALPDRPDDAQWLADFRYQTALLSRFDRKPAPRFTKFRTSRYRATHRPPSASTPKAGSLPLLPHMHGRGAIAGSVDRHDPCLGALALRTGWLVAAPHYSTAPECRFPTQLDEGWSALQTRVECAALHARDAGTPVLAGQILLYPKADLQRDAAYPRGPKLAARITLK